MVSAAQRGFRQDEDGTVISDDDWRLNGQEAYLAGVVLIRRAYRPSALSPSWDHDHCEFCGTKFVSAVGSTECTLAYATEDEYRWVCDGCFADFQDRFQWVVKLFPQ